MRIIQSLLGPCIESNASDHLDQMVKPRGWWALKFKAWLYMHGSSHYASTS